MSPDSASGLPQQWNAFLQEMDSQLCASIELHCLGGFVLAAVYGLPRPTGDVDCIAAIPLEAGFQLTRIAARGSALAQRHSLYFQHVTIADVPQNYEERLTELFPDHFPRLRLFAFGCDRSRSAKLVRNSRVDLEDAKFLAKAGKLNRTALRQRYAEELRPNLTHYQRHDITLKLWLEACFGG